MAAYLLKSGIILTIFYLFYKLLLEKEPIHIFKRIYLLCGLLLAFTIPLITFTTVVEVEPIEFIPYIVSEIPVDQQTTPEIAAINYWPIILWTVYGFGVVLFGLKFFINLLQIGLKVRRNTKQKVNQFTHVLLQNLTTPHTFFSYIFLNKQRYIQHQIPQEVFWHEETHAKQKHSFDVILIELLQVVFWFNPLLYFIKKDVKLNHEFLADRAVLNKGVPLTAYQEILLTFSTNATEPQLANALNYSSIKKRFTIMKTRTSKKAVWIKSLILLPLVAVLVYSFSEQKVVEIEAKKTAIQKKPIKQEVEYVLVSNNVATERMMEEYNEFMLQFENSKMIHDGKYKRAIAIYELMTDKQKTTVKKYPTNVLNIRLSEVKPKVPSQAEFNSWKDKSKFAIWIDGKNVDNSILENYSKSDIVYFSGSFVYKNARSDRFPQSQQFHLYTRTGFEETYKKADYKKYMRLFDKYNKEIEFFNKTDKTDNSELLILKQQVDFLYSNFTEEELKKYNPPKTQKVPNARLKSASNPQDNDVPNISILINKNKEILINEKTSVTLKTLKNAIEKIVKGYTPNQLSKVKAIIEAEGSLKMGVIINVENEIRKAGIRQRKLRLNNNNLNKATPQELTEYNKLAKLYNKQPEDKRMVQLKDLNRLEYIFNKMTVQQKGNAEPFPNCPPPPIKNQDKATKEQVAEYNKLAKHYNKMSKSNMVIKVTDVNRLSYIYNLMTKKQKQNAEPFPNFPPPPPPVKNDLEEIIEVPIKNPPPPPIPEDATPEEKRKMLKAIEKYAKEHPDKVYKHKDKNGKLVEIVEMPVDDKGWVQINNQDHYYITRNGKTTYYNRYGQEVDKKGKLKKVPTKQLEIGYEIPPPPPPAKKL